MATKEPEKRKGGRPAVSLPVDKLEALCQVQCTDNEIAAYFGIAPRTLYRLKKQPKYARCFESGSAAGKISLRRTQFQEAVKGSPSMLIWLGKQYLGQREKVEHTGSEGGPIQVEAIRQQLDRLPDEEFAKLAAANGVDLRLKRPVPVEIDIKPEDPTQ